MRQVQPARQERAAIGPVIHHPGAAQAGGQLPAQQRLASTGGQIDNGRLCLEVAMAETESEFRKLLLVYCLDQRPDGQWVALNRRYKPVGFSSTDWIDYEAHPVGFKFKRPLTEAQVRRLSWKDDPSPERIYLYSDS